MTQEDRVAQAGADLRDGFLVDSAFEVVARDGWRGLTMAAVARAANLTLSDVYRSRTSKADLLRGFMRRIDLLALEAADGGEAADVETPRDRLFDAVLLRFEMMEEYRDALRVLSAELPRDPVSVAAILPDLRRSLAWALEAAEVDSSGLRGAVRVRLLGFICWRTFQVWLDDEGGDLAKTMADLDRRLRRATRALGLERRGSGPRNAGAPRDADPDRDASAADGGPDAATAATA